MNPATYDIQLYRGDYFEMTLRLREGVFNGTDYVPGDYLDLTGWTPKAEIRVTKDVATVLATFTTEVLNHATVPGGVQLVLTSADTTELSVPSAVWDIQLTDPDDKVYTYLGGKVTITKDVTRV